MKQVYEYASEQEYIAALLMLTVIQLVQYLTPPLSLPSLWCSPFEKAPLLIFIWKFTGLQRCTDSSAKNWFLMRLSYF